MVIYLYIVYIYIYIYIFIYRSSGAISHMVLAPSGDRVRPADLASLAPPASWYMPLRVIADRCFRL